MSKLTRSSIFLAVVLSLLCRTAGAFETDVKSAVGYLGGIYGSIWLHEAGHALTLSAFGATDIKISVPRQGCLLCGETGSMSPAGGYRPWQAQAIDASGLLAANLAGEIVIQRQSLHGSAFAQSLLGTSLYSNVAHVYTYYTRYVGVDGYRGNDIDAFAVAGGNPHVLSATLLAYTAWTVQRMKNKEILFFFVNLRF